MKPQLAHTTKVPFSLIDNPRWMMEQKFDGDRLLLVYEDAKMPRGFTRKGEECTLPSIKGLDLTPLHSRHRGRTILDCEMLEDGQIHVFDIPEMQSIDLCGMMYSRRRELLENTFTYFEREGFNCVSVFKTQDEKLEAFYRFKNDTTIEGIMFKHDASFYRFNHRNKEWRKHKFYKTCSAIITELCREGKDESVTICVKDGEAYHEVSGCKIPSRYQQELGIQVGDVIEVRFLTLTPDNKITQPVFIRKRRDIDPETATLERLIDEGK
jgi:ATP-dependent DNA ligase